MSQRKNGLQDLVSVGRGLTRVLMFIACLLLVLVLLQVFDKTGDFFKKTSDFYPSQKGK